MPALPLAALSAIVLVGDGQRARVVDTAAGAGRVVVDRGTGDGQRAHVVDAAAEAGRVVVDRGTGDGQRTRVVDAAAVGGRARSRSSGP